MVPIDAANCLNRAHLHFLTQVYPADVLEYVRTGLEECASARTLTHLQDVAKWLLTVCLQPPLPHARAKLISRLLEVANVCLDLRYCSLLVVLNQVLTHRALTRLQETWQHVAPHLICSLETITQTCSDSPSYTVLRALVEQEQPPACLLPLPILVQDLREASRTTPLPSPQPDGRIAYPFLRILAGYFSRAKGTIYHLSGPGLEDPIDLHRFLCNPVPRLHETRLNDISLMHEPSFETWTICNATSSNI
ncbi:MAG: RasGEF domain-containing protein [Candidatus Paceibacterota bacterium]